MENNKCLNCGNNLQKIKVGSSLSFKCPYCGYAFCTTIADGIEWDSKEYTIIIDKNNETTIDKIKTMASISSLNFIESKKILIQGGVIAKDLAIIIKEKIDKLKTSNIKFNVNPKFPY